MRGPSQRPRECHRADAPYGPDENGKVEPWAEEPLKSSYDGQHRHRVVLPAHLGVAERSYPMLPESPLAEHLPDGECRHLGEEERWGERPAPACRAHEQRR